MAEIYLFGEVGSEITLQNVIDKVKQQDLTDGLTVNIHSPGGGVIEGLAIYNYLKSLDTQITTVSNGLIASIASIIFLAGDTRIINKTDSFLIHLPFSFSGGNAKDLEKDAKELRKIENQLSNIYAKETKLTASEALDLMNKDEFLDSEFLKEKGFVNEIVNLKAVAKLILNNDNKMSENVTKTEVEGLLNKLENSIKSFFKKNKEVINKIVQDANGQDIEFPDVAEQDDPKVGDKALINGAPAEGDVIMPDGRTFVFSQGVLTEIKDAQQQPQQQPPANQAELDAANLEIENLKKELAENETIVKDVQNQLKDFKNQITSAFEYKDKTKKPEEKTKNYRTFKHE